MKFIGKIWPRLYIAIAIVFFVAPLLSMARFAFQRIPVISLGRENLFKRWTIDGLLTTLRDPEFSHSLSVSLKVAFFTVIVLLFLMVPTTLWVHLSAPRWRGVVETVTILPYVVPPIALVVGVSGTYRSIAPWFLASNYSLVPFYAILAMPFTFRSLDVGIKALDLRTLVDAAKSLGASSSRVMWNVLLPNLRTSLINAAFLTITVVLGEFTIASLLLKRTLPMYMAQAQGREPQGALGLGLLILVLTTILFTLVSIIRKKDSKSIDVKNINVGMVT
jgi:putative spermidine/putrescine transport system permease protein